MLPETKRLTIYIGESDTWHHQSLYAAILDFLRGQGCAGATAVRGIAGFGASSRIKMARLVELGGDLPIVITVIDRGDRIDRVLPRLKQMVGAGLMTLDEVAVLQYAPLLRRGFPQLCVRDVMTHGPLTVAPDTSVARVIEILIDKDYTALPVVDAQGRVLGMVGDTDLLETGDVSLTLSIPRAAGGAVVEHMLAQLRQGGRKVAEVMKAPAVSVAATASIADAAHLMVERKLKRLAVIDEDGRLVGVVSRLDLLKTMASVHLPQRAEPAPARAAHTVGDVMSRDVAVATMDTPLDELIDLVVGSGAKRVVVVDGDRRPLGVVTDTDLVQRLDPEYRASVVEVFRAKIPLETIGGEARRHLQKTRGSRAGDLMTRPAVTLRQDTPFADALVLSAERHVKRFPVVDGDGRLVGIVGRMELLAGFLRGAGATGGAAAE
jgi:CBS domain-containing protein